MGVISPIGRGLSETIDAIRKAAPGIKPLRLFPTFKIPPLPAGEISSFSFAEDVPRTHALALTAAAEAMKEAAGPPDAIVIGVTTGGMPLTEELLKKGIIDPEKYRNHSTGSVAEQVARYTGCRGPVLTVSTACSSGSVALKIALEMLRLGKQKTVLAGGVDALCRLTYYGFHSLQLVDETGAHPFDRKRRGMSVGEGAAMLLLTAATSPPDNAIAEFLGAGLSCDACHPASPHPEGAGAVSAMKEALSDAGILPADIDYIHLHGTGTADNDLSEARAIHTLFGDQPIPPLSSVKGALGHSLAGAGAMGAVFSALSIKHGIIPANTGFHEPDPALNLVPVDRPTAADIETALVNAFGFGGNNAALVIGRPKRRRQPMIPPQTVRPVPFTVLGSACLTGAGDRDRTWEHVGCSGTLSGIVPSGAIFKPLSGKYVRRMKRLCRMVMSLAVSAREDNPAAYSPGAVFFGTGWGGLSETHDFLEKLFTSDEQFTSPTDFIGSVHNAAAGHAAIRFQATGPNVTTTGGDCSFEQALMSASLLVRPAGAPFLVIGADEHHETLSPLFDASAATGGVPADGGGALFLGPATECSSPQIRPAFMAYAGKNGNIIPGLIGELGGEKRINDQFGAILAGIPAAQREKGEAQLNSFLARTGYPRPIIDYRRFTGEFASASAVAAVLAVLFVKAGVIPASFCREHPLPFQATDSDASHRGYCERNVHTPSPLMGEGKGEGEKVGRGNFLGGRGILVLGFGNNITAVEIMP